MDNNRYLIQLGDWRARIFAAAKSNDQTIKLQLMQEQDVDWDECLNGACQAEHLELMKYMLSWGAKITGLTLTLACGHTNTNMLQYLLSTFDARTFPKIDFLHFFIVTAFQHKKERFILQFLQTLHVLELRYIFQYACFKNCIDLAEILLKMGIIQPEQINEGLDMACWKGYIELVEFLISHGAKCLKSGMNHAICRKQTRIIMLLKKHGEDDHGLSRKRTERIEKVMPYFNHVFCSDVASTLAHFIDMEFDEWKYKI